MAVEAYELEHLCGVGRSSLRGMDDEVVASNLLVCCDLACSYCALTRCGLGAVRVCELWQAELTFIRK